MARKGSRRRSTGLPAAEPRSTRMVDLDSQLGENPSLILCKGKSFHQVGDSWLVVPRVLEMDTAPVDDINPSCH